MGLMIVLIALLVVIGIQSFMPDTFNNTYEFIVGAVLIAIGIGLAFVIFQKL
jgi:ABC-type maltose transport system permease subunit